MVAAGVVTVVSAGNLGRTAEHPEIWGSITSPGNDPLVITVGAMNTHGTLTHSDDTVASYSSRGPTYLDGLFKPDLVAPGNRILSQATPGSYLAEAYPQLMVDSDYLQLSGSSMATAVVSATVALMLEENKDLNPNLVKLILLTTAIKMQEPSMLEQGNGMLNAKTAVELAKEIDVKKQEVKHFVFPNWTLATEDGPEEVWAGGAFAYGDQIVYGDLVQTDMAGFWGEGVFWTDFLVQPEGVFWTDFFTEGVFWTDTLVITDGIDADAVAGDGD
jgi:subtilisin family serine protease